MPTLQVLRHARAQPFAARDVERALTADGEAAAGAAGRLVAVTGVPDLVLTSTARRAQQTLDEAMRAGGWNADVVEVPALYGAAVDSVLDALASEAVGRGAVLVVGHEPWCSGLVALLTGAQVRMTPGALAVMEVGPGWDALDPAWCALTTFVPGWVAERVATVGRQRG